MAQRSPVLIAMWRRLRWVPAWTVSVVSTTTLARKLKVFLTWSADLVNEHQASRCINVIASCVVLFNARCIVVIQQEQIILIKIDKKKCPIPPLKLGMFLGKNFQSPPPPWLWKPPHQDSVCGDGPLLPLHHRGPGSCTWGRSLWGLVEHRSF